MVKEKRIKGLLYILLFIPLFIISEVKALTFDDFEVTWYYRNKGNESQLLNVIKQEDVPLYASTSEYVNGYTTRVEQTFTKQIQYIVNYQLQMWFSPEQELNYRSDTIQRIIDYSFVDSDFKILNVVANENWNRSSSSSDTVLTINVSMQVLALNNTDAIRFGVYTTNNISIGFYNHTDEIDYYLVDNISIEENANATIIDQNNQIINGQNNLQNSIINTEDSINQNIDDMEQSIVDSNKETQDVIKDQFNTCRDSYNLYDYINNPFNGQQFDVDGNTTTSSTWYSTTNFIKVKPNTSYTIKGGVGTSWQFYIIYFKSDNTFVSRIGFVPNNYPNGYTMTIPSDVEYIKLQGARSRITPSEIMLNEGSTAKEYEAYGEEICTNKMDETNDKLGDLNNSLNDSNVNGSLNNAGSFFDNFSTTDHGGLSGIITAPLVAINQMLNTSCNPMTTNFKGKELSLPCGYDFWNRLGAIQDFVNIVLGGMLCYRIIIKLYKLIERIKNPEDDRLEVMDL